jgi:hypothetical protein
VLPSPPAQPLHPINRQPRMFPFCITGPRPPPRTLVPCSPCIPPAAAAATPALPSAVALLLCSAAATLSAAAPFPLAPA